MATRAVPVKVSFDAAAQASQSAQQGLVIKPSQHIAWNERFVLALPADLAEQLLTPAPGDNPFEGVALSLKVTVLDGSGDRGLGRVLSSTEVPVTFDWLLSQVQALLAVRADAAAAAGATTAAASGSGPQQGQGHAAQAVAQADEKVAQRAASKAAKAYGVGLQETLQLWKPGQGPHAASPGGPEQPAADVVAAATAPTAAAAGQAEGEEGSGGPIMQLRLKLSLDDSQVSSSWYPHQLMRRRLAHLLSTSRASGSAGAQLQLSPPSRQGSRLLSTDSRLPQAQHPLAGAWGLTSGGGARNALRLEGSDVWSPFSYTSLRRLVGAPVGAPHSGVVPIRAGPGLVLEMAYIGVSSRPLGSLPAVQPSMCCKLTLLITARSVSLPGASSLARRCLCAASLTASACAACAFLWPAQVVSIKGASAACASSTMPQTCCWRWPCCRTRTPPGPCCPPAPAAAGQAARATLGTWWRRRCSSTSATSRCVAGRRAT